MSLQFRQISRCDPQTSQDSGCGFEGWSSCELVGRSVRGGGVAAL